MMRKRQGLVIGLLAAVGVAFLAGGPGCNSVGSGGGGRPRQDENVNDNGDGSGPKPGQFSTGLNLDPERFARLPVAINPFAAASNQQLPPSADLTGVIPPIGDQGQLGSCVAWSAGYAGASYSANRRFQWGADTDAHQASAGYLYTKLVEADAQQGTSCGTGTFIATAMDLLVQGGCSSFATVGYSDNSCLEPIEHDAANFRIGSFKRVEPLDRGGIKAELASGNIVIMGAKLYTDFMSFRGTGVFRGNGVFLSQGNQHAAHAMAVVGYDDGLGAYRIMNSWGTGWGDGGFMWMAYETFEATTFEVYSVIASGDREPPNPDPQPGPGPEPGPEPDPQAFLDAAFQFAAQDPLSGDFNVYLVFFWHFDAPVLIHTITVTDPEGGMGQQEYGTWYSDGYVAFFRNDGLQWLSGTYGIQFEVTTLDGKDLSYSDEAYVEALGGDGGEDDGECNNFCIYAFDGECDDGGPGSEFDVCELGSDCYDCGPRDGNEDDEDDWEWCDDSCEFAFDGECDDGGPDADFDMCPLGTDCFDCGPRDGSDDGDGEDDWGSCDDTCEFAFDGVCDDGGPGAEFADCALGTDCSDCGPRGMHKVVPKSRQFRGKPVETPPQAKRLSAGGVQGALGENRLPLTILNPDKQ